MEDDQLFAAEKPARRPPWNKDRPIGASSKQGTADIAARRRATTSDRRD
jgi:hypothetical protein